MINPDVRPFLEGTALAHVATIGPDGAPRTHGDLAVALIDLDYQHIGVG
jgi:hypothetical protein